MTESGENEFEIRFLKEDGVGLITTKRQENYLILDSLDYWYDLIQNEYPKKKKCSCKNEWFIVQFNYIPRLGTDDYREIIIYTTCTVCNKTTKSLSIDIDYSPTDELLTKPITFCEKPNIKYKFNELTSYWVGDDLKDFLSFIFNDLKLHVYCWFFEFPENIRRFEKVSFEMAINIITVNHKYLDFFFSANELDRNNIIKGSDEKGVYIDSDKWRRFEVIHLSSPFVIVGYGTLYYIHFCNQYLDKGNVIDKSKSFEDTTKRLVEWMKLKFVNKRGKNCYDSELGYEKYISKRTNK